MTGSAFGGGAAAQRRGLALVVVLWLLAVLALVATAFATTMRTETRVVANEIENGRARALADAGLHRAVAAIFDLSPDNPWPTEGTPRTIALPGGTVRVAVQDERGRISLNLAPEAMLREIVRALLRDARRADEIVDAILDWRDEDDDRHDRGAEAREYRAAGLPQVPRDGAFKTVSELRSVLGIDAATFARLAPLVTVFSPQNSVDPSVAPEAVLRVLPGFQPEQVEALLAARREWLEGRGGGALGYAFGNMGTGPPAPIPSADAPPAEAPPPAPLMSPAGPQPGATPAPPDPASPPSQPQVGGAGAVFAVRAAARTADGASFVREAVVWVVMGPEPAWWVLDWREGGPEPPAAPETGTVTRRR
jgi:general secretion pathway protein K